MKYLVFSLVIFTLFSIGLAVKCFECNVWKTGYGHHCPENKRAAENRTGKIEVDGCDVCMKVKTTIHVNYYHNEPSSSTIISRVCAKRGNVPKTNGCDYYPAVGGKSTRCYCDNKDFCNGARKTVGYNVFIILATFLSLLLGRMLS